MYVQIIGQGQEIQTGETRSVYANSGRVEPINTNLCKHKLGVRSGKYKLWARAGKYKLGARASKYKFGARGQSRGPGNANTALKLL